MTILQKNRITLQVQAAQADGRKLFIPFIAAGHPDFKTTEELILLFDRLGVDVVEVGVPFSDPLADGPVIQDAFQHALHNGVHMKSILEMIQRVRSKVTLGIILFGAFNPFLHYGIKKVCREMRTCGVDGILIPDIPLEESTTLLAEAHKNELATIYLVSPTTSLQRMKKVARVSNPFVYCVSVKGVTGARDGVSRNISGFLKTVRKAVAKPFVVGFGIATADDARRIAKESDGVVVGSALVQRIGAGGSRKQILSRVEQYLSEILEVCHKVKEE